MEPVEKPTLAPALLRIHLLLDATILFYWQLWHPMFRLTWEPANNAFILVAIALPWLVVIRTFLVKRWWMKVGAAVAALPLLIITLASPLFLMGNSGGPVSEVRWDNSMIRVYRLNGGALSSDTMRVRQEMPLLPGVKLVRNVGDFTDCDVHIIPALDGIKITHQKYGEPIGEGAYILQPFVYF